MVYYLSLARLFLRSNFLFDNEVDEGGDIGYVDGAVGVDVADGVGVLCDVEHLVDEGSNVGSVHFSVGIDVASH